MNPRVDLTEPTAPAPVNDKAYIPCPARGLRRVKRSDFLAINPIYVLKPVCVYSSLLLRCFIDHNISFGNHITLNSIEYETRLRQVLPRGRLVSTDGLGRDAGSIYIIDQWTTRCSVCSRYCGRHWGKDGLRRYGDPDVETSVLSWRPRVASASERFLFQYSGAFYQCHLKQI